MNNFRNEDEIIKQLKEQLIFINNLPNDLKKSLLEYTKEEYVYINKDLREKGDCDRENYFNILKIFENIPYITYPLVVYRGIDAFKYENNCGLISTSLDKKLSLTFIKADCCLLEINIAPGSKIIPLFSISAHENEKEILLNPKANIKITRDNQLIYNENNKKEVKLININYSQRILKEVNNMQDIKDPSTDDRELVIKRIKEFIIYQYDNFLLKRNNEDEDDEDEEEYTYFDLKLIINTIEKLDKNIKLSDDERDIIFNWFEIYKKSKNEKLIKDFI